MRNLSDFHLTEAPRIISKNIPDKNSKHLLQRQKEIEGAVVSYPVIMPIGIARAQGAIIEDVDGNQFIDFFAGCGVLNVGHSNPFVLKYVQEQQEYLIHALDFPTENKIDFIENLLSRLPISLRNDYKVSFGGPTGSDAVESAIKLAKIKTGRDGIIAFTGGYHGMSSGALAVTSNKTFRNRFTSLIPNVSFVPYSYCYRCPFGKEVSSCSYDCVDHFSWILENSHSGVVKPAAIILEPLQGEGGNILPKSGYLKKITQIAQEHGVIVILDEIQSGFYRTGSFLEFMNSDVVPDIITFSKGFGGIGFPLSGLIYRKDIEAWGEASHIGTFRANQVSIAAARGALDFIDAYEIATHVEMISKYVFDKLNILQSISSCIGDIRGKGLMIGVEFVKDKNTKKPFPEFLKEFRKVCFQKGLLFEVGGHYNNVMRLVPPLIITKKIVDQAIKIMTTSLLECQKNKTLNPEFQI
ncbi:aspartate aminotransferase family protein [Aquimarina sp. RZ0]|uniref:aspartate aminotransferase family protein n=1 Tax=Aquimarina sp. RZ0 TaxID=2607730 RepID=UPI0011F3DA22|nr:aspartate aminotransferase family protein [Aquimarina sp. RZ0]KAA1242926.1 aspartate aminotransferase family protein [Aquimarina sp. RZ0]